MQKDATERLRAYMQFRIILINDSDQVPAEF